MLFSEVSTAIVLFVRGDSERDSIMKKMKRWDARGIGVFLLVILRS